MRWDEIQLGEVIDVKHGYAFKSRFFSDSGEYILLTPGNCYESGGLKLKGEKEKYYIGEFPAECLLNEGDMLVVMTDLINTAPILGGSFIIPRSNRFLHNQRLGLVQITDDDRIDKTFLYYLLNTYHYRAQVRGSASGATVRHTAPNRIKECKVRIPNDTNYQRKIGLTLQAYDASIENNLRRMALLEEAARLLYQEWFVHLRFPGHEHTPISNGLPEGWERKRIAELCESIDYGYTASAELTDVGPRFLRITDIVPEFIDWSDVPHCVIEDIRLNKFRLLEGDIVVARTGATVGYAKRLNKRHPEAVFASYLVRFRLKEWVDNLMVGTFLESSDYKAYVQSRIGGAAQPNANAQVLAAAEILVPTESLQQTFREAVEPMVDQREVLQLQNQKLRAARDLLLPRLMSGEIEV
jgi:type I restriction enzyme, S subunit